jgi:transposase
MTLGYSRRLFARATRDEKLLTFIRCHEEALEHFAGIPHELLYDNTKSVVLSRDFEGQEIRWNPIFWDFSSYRGFQPRTCRPYRAQTKGKVESGVKYVKRFLRGKAFETLEQLNEALSSYEQLVEGGAR